jgi:hypothetical protein
MAGPIGQVACRLYGSAAEPSPLPHGISSRAH